MYAKKYMGWIPGIEHAGEVAEHDTYTLFASTYGDQCPVKICMQAMMEAPRLFKLAEELGGVFPYRRLRSLPPFTQPASALILPLRSLLMSVG